MTHLVLTTTVTLTQIIPLDEPLEDAMNYENSRDEFDVLTTFCESLDCSTPTNKVVIGRTVTSV